MLTELQQLSGIQENVPLARHTTFKIGGPAKYFYVARSTNDLLKAVKLAEELKLDYFILGGGSNLLVADKGFDGLVIKARNEEFVVADNADGPMAIGPADNTDEMVKVVCGAGLTVGRLLGLISKHNLGGLEFMAGIFGTVGGAAAGNAGALGRGFGDLVKSVKLYKEGQIRTLSQAEMRYQYRESVVKKSGGVILEVTLELPAVNADQFKGEVLKIIKEKKAKIPPEPSAGCIFKNIEMDKIKIDVSKIAKALDVTIKEFQRVACYKLQIGFIMDKLNLKGKQIGGAKVSELHGNFIINTGKATAEEVVTLISFIKEQVRVKLGLQLEEEIKYVGF